ncbi:unnamed protein product, partial [Discosporangium mesarthrocarpum]
NSISGKGGKKSKMQAAEESYRRALADRPDVFSLSAFAQFLVDVGREEEAITYFERALAAEDATRSKETLGLTLGWYAALLEEKGRDEKARAEELYKQALRLNPQDPLAMGNYAVFLHRIKLDKQAAKIAYDVAVKTHPSHASIICKYGCFAKHVLKDYDKARQLFEKAIEANPVHAESLGNLAVLLHGQQLTKQSEINLVEDLYKRATHADPMNVNTLSNYGLFLAEVCKDVKGAERLYKTAAAIDPGHANSIYNYAVLLDSGLKMTKRAEDMYRRCLDVNPRHSYALYNLAVLREEHAPDGNYSETKQLYERAIESNPTDALTLADYGRFLAAVEKDFHGATANLRAALHLDPNCTTALFNLGKLILQQSVQGPRRLPRGASMGSTLSEAKYLLLRAVKGKRDHPGANLCLARMLKDEG